MSGVEREQAQALLNQLLLLQLSSQAAEDFPIYHWACRAEAELRMILAGT